MMPGVSFILFFYNKRSQIKDDTKFYINQVHVWKEGIVLIVEDKLFQFIFFQM